MLLQDALGTAIEYEHRVRDHYAEAARRATDPVAQRIFAILAREEQGHVDYLETRLREWKASGVVKAETLKSILPEARQVQRAAPKGTPDPTASPVAKVEIDFLKEALELERKTSAFYKELVAKLEPAHRGLFERFLEIEEGHVTIVQAEIDAVAGHGHWFDFMEFSLEK